MRRASKYIYLINKRVFDIVLSLLLIPWVVPVMLVSAVLIIIDSGLPLYFTQRRVGYKNIDFIIIKLRTMLSGEKVGRAYLEKNYVTPVGRILRKFHIDEIPQLFLILFGSMSFVGPRPLVAEHLNGHGGIEKRQSVKPGLMCYAQNELYEKQFLDVGKQIELDLKYVDDACIIVDFRIIWKTVNLHLKKIFPGK